MTKISNPAAPGLTFTELAPTPHQPATTGWQDYDYSAEIPAGAQIALICCYTTVVATKTLGIRENGSALSRTWQAEDNSPVMIEVNLDSGRIIEYYGAVALDNVHMCMGYWS